MLKKSFFCKIYLINMQQKNEIKNYWSTLVGEFYNPDHDQIKKKLLAYFEDYKKKQPSSRRGNENFNLYESRYDLHKDNNEDLQKVFQFLLGIPLPKHLYNMKDVTQTKNNIY